MSQTLIVNENTAVRQPQHPSIDAVGKRVTAYFRQLGVKDEQLLESLSQECLHRAIRKLAPTVPQEELLRRALEEAQRRFDHALAHALNLPNPDFHSTASAEAALLLGGDSSDFLFSPKDEPAERIDRLNKALPYPTPPETPLGMEAQPISFFFDSSLKHRS